MEIIRVDSYTDNRFSQKVLYQHGCFLVEKIPYEVEIFSDFEAVVRGKNKDIYPQIIEEFRFYTPHITIFYDKDGNFIKKYPSVSVFHLPIDQIQPSQFYVDREKIEAICNFIYKPEDIIIQVMPYNGHYISLDGHTRLYYAVLNGWDTIRAVESTVDMDILKFVEEAQRRKIYSPKDMELVNHNEYEEKWNRFCDEYFRK